MGAKDEKLEESFGYFRKNSYNCFVMQMLINDTAGKCATAINV